MNRPFLLLSIFMGGCFFLANAIFFALQASVLTVLIVIMAVAAASNFIMAGIQFQKLINEKS